MTFFQKFHVLKRTGPLFCLVFLSALPAQAVIRTFVASNGNDANACSRTAPCRTFGAAIAQTNTGGEVIVLDTAGYGPFTITKSVSVICPSGIYASITQAMPGAGATVNGSGITVLLKGLSFVGQTGGGANGISFQSGSSLRVVDCSIRGFSSSGILHNAVGGSLFVDNTVISDAFYGIYLNTSGGAGTICQATIDHCQLERNFTGLICSFGSDVAANHTTATEGTYGFYIEGSVANPSRLNLWDCVSSFNSYGIETTCNMFTGIVLAANSLITRSTTSGLDNPNGGPMFSAGGNVMTLNSGNETFTTTIAQK